MKRWPLLVFVAIGVIGVVGLWCGVAVPLPRLVLYALVGVGGVMTVQELAGRPVPFLRWSFLRMLLSMNRLMTEWQVGDGREEAAARYVLTHAPAGNLDAAIAAIDEFAYRHRFLINVGDEKGQLLDTVVARVQPRRALELGAYVGYSALRIARKLPEGAHLYSVEFNAANAAIARRIIAHAGVADRVTFIDGSLGDGGKTLELLAREHGFSAGSLDLVFIDHAKDAYLPDLRRLVEAGWLHPGSVVVADNVGFPGAPEYRAHVESEEGKRWRTTAHAAHVEYQSLIPDVVLEPTFLG